MPRDSKDIVQRVQRNASGAVEEFVRAFWAPVWRAAYAVTADAQLAEDAAQEAFVRALRALHRVRERPVEPWLRRIAVNCAIDQLRRRPDGWAQSDAAPEPVWVDSTAAIDADLLAAVLGPSADRRIVVVLHFWFDYTHKEIGAALGIPPGTVASRLSRGLDDLSLRITEVPNANAAR